MKRTLLLFVAGVLGTLAALAGATVTTSPLEGPPGEEVILSVSVTNDMPLSAMQLTAKLGNAVTAVEGGAEVCGRAESHGIVAASDADGCLQILVFSTDMAPIAAGSGEIARIRLRLGSEPTSLSVIPTVKVTGTDGNILPASAAGLNLCIEAARAEFPSGLVYDFGSVPIRNRYTLDIPVCNTGTSPLVIDAMAFSAAEYEAESELPVTLVPGETKTLAIAYSPLRRGATSNTVAIQSNSASDGGSTILRLLAEPFAVNELHVGSADGVCDSEVRIPLTINNMDPVSGFTIEFDLPGQLEYVDGSFALADNRNADHVLSVNASGHRLTATAYSLTDTPFAGNDGEIASFAVRLNGRDNVYLRPSKVVLAATVDGGDVENVLSACHGANINISYPYIWVNNRLSMGRTPVTTTASQTLDVYNYGNAPLTIDRISTDGDIDVAVAPEFPLTIDNGSHNSIEISHDAINPGTFNGRLLLYCNDPDNRLKPVDVDYERYEPNQFAYSCEAAKGGGVLNIELDNYTAIYGIQFDIRPADGFSLGVPQTEGRASEWSAEVRPLGGRSGGDVRIFCFPLGGGSIAPGTGTVLSIPYTYDNGTPDGEYTFRVSDVKMSNCDMNDCCSILDADYPMVTVTHTTTGLEPPAIASKANGAVHTVDGILLRDTKGRHGFVIVNGKVVYLP